MTIDLLTAAREMLRAIDDNSYITGDVGRWYDAIALAERAIDAAGWQPIETAPQAPDNSPECWDLLCHWVGGEIGVAYGSKGKWWPGDHSNGEDDTWLAEPTHWQPLPAPPKGKTDE
jgi:hypothetical protein